MLYDFRVRQLTKRAPDAGDSGAIPSIFLRLGFFQLDGFAVPAPAQVTQSVGWLVIFFGRNKLNQQSFWSEGENITLRGVGIKVFWAFPTIVVKDAPDLIVLYMPAGVLGRNVTHKPTTKELLSLTELNIVECTWQRTDVLMLIVPGEAFSTYIMWDTGTKNLDCWYVNLQEPIKRTSIGFDTMDNMLDVVISPDMSDWEWKDDDEFAEAQKIGFYSAETAREIWSEGEKAVRLITSERRSLYEEWEKWQANPKWEIPKLSPLWNEVNLARHSLQNNA